MKKACHAVRKSLQEAYYGLDGRKWTEETIKYFNIHFQKCSFQEMFAEGEQVSTGDEETIFDALEKGFTPVVAESKNGVRFDYNAATPGTVDFWAYLEALANHPNVSTYSVAFLHEMLRLTLQAAPNFAVFATPNWHLLLSGDRHKVRPSFVVADRHVHAVVHVDRSTDSKQDHPFAQIVAEAFTAYQLALEESCYSGKKPESIEEFDLLLAVVSETVISFLRVNIPQKALRHVQAGKRMKEPLIIHQLEVKQKDSFNFLLPDQFRTILNILRCWRRVLCNKLDQATA
jgi:hypothetical protein